MSAQTAVSMTEEYTTSEAAAYLRLSPTMIIKLIHSGKLRHRVAEERRGKVFLITYEALEEYRIQWEADKKERDRKRREQWRKWRKTA